MSSSGSTYDLGDNRRLEVNTLTTAAIDGLHFRVDGETEPTTVQRLLKQTNPAATDVYVAKLKNLAQRCHADEIQLIGMGGEAMVFELFRKGKPLQAVIRMEAGLINETLTHEDDVELEEEPHTEEFSPIFEGYSTMLPNYYARILTTREDTEHRGVSYKIMPKIFNITDFQEAGVLSEGQVVAVIKQLEARAFAAGLDTSEIVRGSSILPDNMGIYLAKHHRIHPVYLDPGAMLHGADRQQIPEYELKGMARDHSVPPSTLIQAGSLRDQEIRKEVEVDAIKLFAGEPTNYARRINNLTTDQWQGAWQRYVTRDLVDPQRFRD